MYFSIKVVTKLDKLDSNKAKMTYNLKQKAYNRKLRWLVAGNLTSRKEYFLVDNASILMLIAFSKNGKPRFHCTSPFHIPSRFQNPLPKL